MVKDLLNASINKVIQIDVNKMGSLVQATGGITMQNPKAFKAEGYEFKQGTVNLQTADQVQAYMTQIDDTDLDASITRIQNVSMELYGNIQKIAHMKKLESFNYYREILYAFSNTVKTNISFNDAKTIVMSYSKALKNTSKLNLHTTDENGAKVVSQTELDSVKTLFEKSLK
ncbi:Transcriptional regulator LytR [Lactococcus lactis]|nr:Transcriptional regulator LytR [Lactococcus lactis]